MMPQPGMKQQHPWANKTMAALKQRDIDPAAVGMGGANQQPAQPNRPYAAYNPNVANSANAARPPAFQASYQNFDGTTSQQPNYQQRDAFIARINDVLGRLQQQSWQQPTGAPQFDFAKMWNQAGSMVEGGWQNPFARRQT